MTVVVPAGRVVCGARPCPVTGGPELLLFQPSGGPVLLVPLSPTAALSLATQLLATVTPTLRDP